MIKTKLFVNNNSNELEEDINYTLKKISKSKHCEFIDIKMSMCNNFTAALIIYEKNKEDKEDR